MSTKTMISVEEYLRTSYEDGDRDYLDGEVEERHVGEKGHSLVQALLGFRLMQLRESLGIQVLPEIRIQIDEKHFRVADVAVWTAGPTGRRVPKVPPFLAIEILSPEDRIMRLMARVADYLRAGVQTVWLIDPELREALIFTPDHPTGVPAEILRTPNPAIEIPLVDVLPSEEDLA